MKEVDVKKALKEKLEKRGVRVVRFEDLYTSHIPDMLLASRGKSIWLEVKHVKDKADLAAPWKWPAYRTAQSHSIWELSQKSGILAFYYVYGEQESVITTISAAIEAEHTKQAVEGIYGSGYQIEELLKLIERNK